MLVEALLASDGDREVKVILVLPDFDGFGVEADFVVGAEDGHFGPLRLVQANLEQAIECYDREDSEGAE